MRMHSAPTLKAAMNVNARKDSRVMDTPSVQVIKFCVLIWHADRK